MRIRRIFAVVWSLVLILSLTPSLGAAAPASDLPNTSTVSLVASPLTSAMVGTTVTWTATSTDTNPLEYQFSTQLGTGKTVIVRDFESANSFTWTPTFEGSYTVNVVAREIANTSISATNSSSYSITTRITAGVPVVTPTANPLVALYSIPPCGKGSVLVKYGVTGSKSTYLETPSLPCSSTVSSNFYIVGMRASTNYTIQYIKTAGTKKTYGPTTTYTSGAIPSNLVFSPITVPVKATSAADLKEPIVFHDTVGLGTNIHMFATDILGNVIWYYNNSFDPAHQYVDRPLIGGDIIADLGDSQGPNQKLQVFDPAGNPVQETTVGRIDEQLALMPSTPGHTVQQVSQLHHETNKLPNGHYIVQGYVEQLSTQYQGGTPSSPVDILGDEIIDLDSNFQVDWTWNEFDWLSLSRTAVLGGTCAPNEAGCPTTLTLASQTATNSANDWTHTNATIYSSSDHNLIISVRNQDWIVKINYQDATTSGTGENVVWRLGNGGDFTLNNPSNFSSPWFSGQHGLEFHPPTGTGTTATLITFDDGNTRCGNGTVTGCDSRGQSWQLDETNHIATPTVEADMGNYSGALGWAQSLSNGNLSFTSGFQGVPPNLAGQEEEFNSTGTTKVFVIQDAEGLYRSYRMATMYNGCCGD